MTDKELVQRVRVAMSKEKSRKLWVIRLLDRGYWQIRRNVRGSETLALLDKWPTRHHAFGVLEQVVRNTRGSIDHEGLEDLLRMLQLLVVTCREVDRERNGPSTVARSP